MNRNLGRLVHNSYDLLVIGGGIYGACVAWDASLRGLSVALVEQADFGAATSANSLKTIHGGLRYLQHADFKRMRESIRERKTLLYIAPHLVHPLPVIVPTYGHGVKGPEAMRLALLVNDGVSYDRNIRLDPQKWIPRGQIVSAKECLQRIPGVSPDGLTGGAIFYDAQVYNSERLTLSFLRSAVQAGAEIANYVKAIGFLKTSDRITGIQAKDVLTGETFDIQAKAVINTSGPWVSQVIQPLTQQPSQWRGALAKAMNFVTRPLLKDYAIGISSRTPDQNTDAINKRSRLLFIAPWRDKSLVGTWYAPFEGNPDTFEITSDDVQTFLDEVNQAYPAANLKQEDIYFVHAGLLPSSEVSARSEAVQLNKHYRLYDHRQEGIQGLLSVSGVKYTTARDVAAKAVDWVFKHGGQKPPRSVSAITPVYGGQISDFQSFLKNATQQYKHHHPDNIRRLVYNYGSEYRAVLEYCDNNMNCDRPFADDLQTLKAEILHGVREEMAQTLSDVVFRRTELGSSGSPGAETLKYCAEVMGSELQWSEGRVEHELQAVTDRLNRGLGYRPSALTTQN
jgi:glycerol-3-phosphate dehydrogenase